MGVKANVICGFLFAASFLGLIGISCGLNAIFMEKERERLIMEKRNAGGGNAEGEEKNLTAGEESKNNLGYSQFGIKVPPNGSIEMAEK
ncbi:MAG: hypothetical protein MJ252_22010 [archaeon]|nr:hypothetical protein [archaeon]